MGPGRRSQLTSALGAVISLLSCCAGSGSRTRRHLNIVVFYGRMASNNVITIDGGAHTGKSTAAQRLAAQLGWDWVSTGAFYRGLACVADAAGIAPDDEAALVGLIGSQEFQVVLTAEATRFESKGRDLTGEIFTPRIGDLTPRISRLPGVRAGLLQAQRDLIRGRRGLVVEGRDCGTVVFPDALLKFWFIVSDEAAGARWAKSHQSTLPEALEHIRERNRRDAGRATAQMKPASDAITVDTSDLDPDAVRKLLIHHCQQAGLVSLFTDSQSGTGARHRG